MVLVHFEVLFRYFSGQVEEDSMKLQDKSCSLRDSKRKTVGCKSETPLPKTVPGLKFKQELLNFSREHSYQNTSGIFTYNKVLRSLGVIDTAVIGESVLSNDYRNIIVRRLDPLQQFAQPPWHHLHHSSTQSAQELVTINIDDKHKCLILYIKDLCKHTHQRNNRYHQNIVKQQENYKRYNKIIHKLLQTVLNQNCFTCEGKFYGHNKGVAMGLPISSTTAEIFLQYFTSLMIKHYRE